MPDTITAEIINNWLKTQVKIPLSEQPLFRLAWSEDLYEVRRSLFPIFDAYGTKIGESERFQRAKKYNWIKDRWIFEQWLPPEIMYDPDIVGTENGDYICKYVFDLPLNLAVVQFMVRASLKPNPSYTKRYYDNLRKLEEKEKEADRIVMDCLNDEGPLVSQFHDGTAILNPLSKSAKN